MFEESKRIYAHVHHSFVVASDESAHGGNGKNQRSSGVGILGAQLKENRIFGIRPFLRRVFLLHRHGNGKVKKLVNAVSGSTGAGFSFVDGQSGRGKYGSLALSKRRPLRFGDAVRIPGESIFQLFRGGGVELPWFA